MISPGEYQKYLYRYSTQKENEVVKLQEQVKKLQEKNKALRKEIKELKYVLKGRRDNRW